MSPSARNTVVLDSVVLAGMVLRVLVLSMNNFPSFKGALVTLMPLIVMDIEGVDLISDCFGFLSISAGSAALLGGPLAGMIFF